MNRPRRIPRHGFLFVSSSPEVWGAETSELLLARELVQAGHDTRLLCRSTEFADRWPGRAEVKHGAAFWRRLLMQGMRSRAIVSCSYGLLPAFWMLRLVPGRPRLVVDAHVVFPTSRGRRRLRWLLFPADLSIAVSHFAAEQLGSRRPVAVVYRPVDSLPQSTPSASGRRVGIVGRIDSDKRIELVVEAVSELADVQLIIRGAALGVSQYATDVHKLADKLLPGRAFFEGRVEQVAAMDGLDCLVVANVGETMGRTVVEAQLAGVPVVVPDSGGPTELVVPGRTGFCYRAGDAGSLATSIQEALDAGWRVVEEARAAAIARHNPAAVARRYAVLALGVESE